MKCVCGVGGRGEISDSMYDVFILVAYNEQLKKIIAHDRLDLLFY